MKDVRPGLVFKASTKRKIEVEQKKKVLIERGRMKPQNVLEQERRAEGLKSAIPAGNKGFAMLCKMGYDPGRGLGKTGEGRLEPVGVEIKLDRGGLGREAVLAEIDKRKKEMRAARVSAAGASVSISEFRNRMRNQAAQKLVAADLGKSQRVCLRIDADRGIEEPPEKWFWPSEKKKEEDEEEAAGPKKAKIQDESESEDSAEEKNQTSSDSNTDEKIETKVE